MLELYGLVAGDDLWTRMIHRRIAMVANGWPLVVCAHLFAIAILLCGRLLTSPALPVARIAVLAGLSGLLLFAQAGLVLHRAIRALAPHVQVRLGMSVMAGQAILLAVMLASVLAAPAGAARIAALTALSLSTMLIGIAVAPVRALLTVLLLIVTSILVLVQGSLVALPIGLIFVPLALVVAMRSMRGDREDAERSVRAQTHRDRAMRLVAEFETHGGGWFFETDRNGLVTYLSDGVVGAADRRQRPVIGSHLTDVLRLDSPDPESERTLAFHLSTRTSFTHYAVQATADVQSRWWSISGRPVVDEIGQFRGFIGYGSDLTGKRRADAEISRMALFDGLTGLANRHRMRLSLDNALKQPGSAARPTSLFMLDLDRFKAVNDTLGHQAGDALLKLVGQRLQASVGAAGLVGRLGGDEFQVIISDGCDREALQGLAGRVIAALSAPYSLNGMSISIGCSLGIAVAPEDGEDSETLIRNADLALYSAKAAGRGVHRFYHSGLLAAAQNRRQLEDDLREAFARGQFHLAYQPVVSTRDERIVGYEALLRWNHPVHGPISPADFIPIAEDCGLIERIGEWVLRTACEAASHWAEDVRVAVNVSPIQFASPTLPMLVASALAQSGLTSSRLELEITEGVFLSEDPSTDRMFASLKGLGVRLALDDFGTGYSSLGYLKQAPFDKIKIDQSFVRGAAVEGSRNAAIIRAIVALADALGMETTAEGVEVQDEIALIRELGCTHIQGYVYGKAIPADEVVIQLGDDAGRARPSGARISREPRMGMLRNATVEVGAVRSIVRLRNITANGAMIDGIANLEAGQALAIEIFPGETVAARVQWTREGKTGLRFDTPIKLDQIIAAVDTILRRVA